MARHAGTGELITEGTVYVLQSPNLGSHVFKIGMTTGSVEQRAIAVSRERGVEFEVVHKKPTSDVYRLESRVHRTLDAHRVHKGHPILKQYNLANCRELFSDLDLHLIKRTIKEAVSGLEAEDTWCRNLRHDWPEILSRLGVREWANQVDIQTLLKFLIAKGSREIAEFALAQLGSDARFTIGKTCYLTWRFGGKARLWVSLDQPQGATIVNQRRFEGDLKAWEAAVGPEICYEYRGAKGVPELRLILWRKDHLEGLQHIIQDVMPAAVYW